MRFFDCNCRIGFERVPLFTFSQTADELIQEMDYFGIDKALVYHSLAKDYNPGKGNELLVNMISRYNERLFPIYVFIPNTNTIAFQPDYFKEQLKDYRIKGVLFTPLSGRYEFNISLFKDILTELNDMKMPVFVEYEGMSPFGFLPNYRELDEFLQRYTKTPLVLINAGYRFDIELYALAKGYKNLYLDISCYQGNCAIENFCETFGSKRLLFGTGYPRFSPGASKLKIEKAYLEDSDKLNIAYGNLSRLCEEIDYNAK